MVSPGAQRNVGSVVRGGSGQVETLVLSDAEAIAEQIDNVSGVAPVVSTTKQVTAKGTNTNTAIYGVTESYLTVKT
jgi:hypothetical protein